MDSLINKIFLLCGFQGESDSSEWAYIVYHKFLLYWIDTKQFGHIIKTQKWDNSWDYGTYCPP